MVAKALLVLALAMSVNAGAVTYLSNPSVGTTSQQSVRGPGGFSSATTYSKAVDSPFSSVRKFDSRVTNDAVAYAAPFAHYAHAPVAQYAAAPVAHYAHAPVAQYAAAPVAHYANAPVAQYAAAPVAHYANAPVAQYAAAPAFAQRAIAAHPASLLGVAYSPVQPGVATLTFDGFGVHYGY